MTTYVLMYVNADNRLEYIQGSMDKINKELTIRVISGEIDEQDWEFYNYWQLFTIKDNCLVPVNSATVINVPQFTVE